MNINQDCINKVREFAALHGLEKEAESFISGLQKKGKGDRRLLPPGEETAYKTGDFTYGYRKSKGGFWGYYLIGQESNQKLGMVRVAYGESFLFYADFWGADIPADHRESIERNLPI